MFFGPHTDRREMDKTRTALKQNKVCNAEMIIYQRNGEKQWVNYTVVPVQQENSELKRYVYILRNVTKRHQDEEQLRQTNENLKKANAELDRFVYSASHDLKAPLASVSGLIRLIKMDVQSLKNTDYLDKIEISIEKLNQFINEIINYSRNTRQVVQNNKFDFGELVEEIKEELRYLKQMDRIRIAMELSEPMILTDRSRLKVVLSNLIANSVKYHNLKNHDPYILVRFGKENDFYQISVEDNGIGIAREHQEKIFDMFYRGNEFSNGSGLGLYIVKETIAKLNGTIEVKSASGEGSAFKVEIPVKM
jgi:signal transduction histidine kinase